MPKFGNVLLVLVPVLTASLASCTAIFDNPAIFSAVFTASFTSSSAGNTLLTKPVDEKVRKILSQIAWPNTMSCYLIHLGLYFIQELLRE